MNVRQFYAILKKSVKLIGKNVNILWIGIVLELAFLFIYSFVSDIFSNVIYNNLTALGAQAVSETSEISNDFFGDIIASPLFGSIVMYSIILLLIVFIIYCILQGLIWKYCMNISEGAGKYLPYMKKFFFVNLFWLPFFVLYVLLDFFIFYIDTVGRRIDPQNQYYLSNITFLILIFIAYFAFISYVMINRYSVWKSIKLCFLVGIKKVMWIVMMYLSLIVVLIVINYIMVFLGSFHEYLVILIGSVVIIPIMLWGRMFISMVVTKIDKK